MTTATTPVTTIVTPATLPFTTPENIFSICHQFFDQYRKTIFVLTGTVMAAFFYNKLWVNRKFYPSKQLMQGKTVLITGGNTGIGYETAKDLLKRGARVIIACRNMDKGRQAVEELCSETECDEKHLRLMECDLSSLDSVLKFAELYNSEEQRLDVLICNAGIFWSDLVVTKEGFNTVIQTNYLSHFLLTNLLLNKLKECRPSRIINVSSDAHKAIKSIEWSDAFTQLKNPSIFYPYIVSKAFQVMSTYKLKKDLLDDGIDVFAIDPGFVWTSIHLPLRQAIGLCPYLLLYPIIQILKFAFSKTPKTGARTTIYCAVEPALQGSPFIYFESCAPSKTIPFCTDPEAADTLWKLSAEAANLE